MDKRFESWRREFGLFSDNDGVLRFGGRMSREELPCEVIHLIFVC